MKLKEAFTTAPLLKHPDPQKQFIVEVDALNTGVGAILSQKFGEKHKMHPVAFFSRKLTQAERKYDMAHELLAIKLVLDEWRHWLEGASLLLVVLMDHKNLEYLWTAKRLNPHQARWALFFTRFQFTISYHPVTKNTKADALSRKDSVDQEEPNITTILQADCWVNAIQWDIDREIDNNDEPRPMAQIPPDKVYVPTQL